MGYLPDEVANGSILQNFSLDIKAGELKEYCAKRADHHESRAKIYRSKQEEIAKLKADDDDVQQMATKFSNSNDPTAALESSAKTHNPQGSVLPRSLPSTSARAATYRLSLNDLTVLEIYPNR